MTTMARSLFKIAALTLANLLLPFAILTFASGFFPYKPVLSGLASFQHDDVTQNTQPEAVFDRIIFMVVDALRSDFVYGYDSGFHYAQRLDTSLASFSSKHS
jgi:ethanolaminephosphotransferase